MTVSNSIYLAHAGITSALGAVLTVVDGQPSMLDNTLHAAGIGLDGPVFLAGIFFALAAGFVAMAHTPPEDRVDKWATLATAALIGTLVAILQPFAPLDTVKELPPQAVMLLGGLFSRKTVDWGRSFDIGSFFRKGAK